MKALDQDDDDYSAIMVSDHGKGMVSAQLMERLRMLATTLDAAVIVAPTGSDWRRYGQVDIIRPNATDLVAFTGLDYQDDVGVELALMRALELCDAGAIVVTRGDLGASVMLRGSRSALHLPICKADVADTCGTGDTHFAMLGAMVAAGCCVEAAVDLAQIASSLAVRRKGNATIGATDLLANLHGTVTQQAEKVRGAEDVSRMVRRWQAMGLSVGFTYGCFDPLCVGHVRSLEAVRSRCDRLVVAVHSDASIRRSKGEGHPVKGEVQRAAMVANLSATDAVTILADDTPEHLIADVRPNLLCEASDCDPEAIGTGDLVPIYGETAEVTPFMSDPSAKSIVALICQQLETSGEARKLLKGEAA